MGTGDRPGLDERRVEVQVVRPAHQWKHHVLSCSTRAMLAQRTSMTTASLQGSVHVAGCKLCIMYLTRSKPQSYFQP